MYAMMMPFPWFGSGKNNEDMNPKEFLNFYKELEEFIKSKQPPKKDDPPKSKWDWGDTTVAILFFGSFYVVSLTTIILYMIKLH